MGYPYIDGLVEKAKRVHGRVAVPDAQLDERVMAACCDVHKHGWMDIVFTGSRAAHAEMAARSGLDIDGIELIDPDELSEFPSLCEEYAGIRAKDALTSQQVGELLREPVYLACMLHRRGIVEGVCSGMYYSTADLARASIKTLGMQPGISRMSACSTMYFPHSLMGDDLVYITADTAIIPVPTAEQLAEIAILTADTASAILPHKPRVAMLSFSTLGSASHEAVDKVVKALGIVKSQRPDICVDGEFQMDSALSAHVASKKVKRESEVAGRANVLIWPDLQSGNIASKAMMLMGGGMLIGAPLLGLNGLVSDHSRGASVEEIVAHIAFVGAQVRRPA